VADELVADCLRNLHMKHGEVKFLGSYPSGSGSGNGDADLRSAASTESAAADVWLTEVRKQIQG